jgi:hypothetical protein
MNFVRTILDAARISKGSDASPRPGADDRESTHPHSAMPRPPRHIPAAIRQIRWVVVLAAISRGMAQPAGQPLAEPPAPQNPAEPRPLTEEAASLFKTVENPAAPKEARDSAADRLVSSGDRGVLAAVARGILGPDESRSGAPVILLNAVARSATPPSELFKPVAEFTRAATPERLAPALTALGSFRIPEAVAALIEQTAPDRPPAARAAAFRALVRLTGRDDLADDRARWLEWFDRARGLDRDEWNAVILAGLARRNDRLEAARADAGTRLTDAFRRLYLVVSGSGVEDRPRILASLLLDDRDELRNLGFEIVSRELSAGTPQDSSVGAAVIRLLGHGSPGVRARAASLVNQLAPAGAAEAVTAALVAEQDAAPAAALLQAAARWPSEGVKAPALKWIAAGAEVRAASVQALLALSRAGLLANADLNPIRDVLGAIDPLELTSSEIRLLAAVGDDEHRRRIAQALAAESPNRRIAAAESLSDRREFLDLILAAAAKDPGLYDTAVRCVAAHRRNADGFWALYPLRAPTEDAHRAGLLRVATQLPIADLLAVAQGVEDPTLREAVLARLAEPQALQTVEDPESVAAGLVLLAETRLAVGRPDATLLALNAIPPDAMSIDTARIERLRVIALLWIGRLDRASELNAPAGAWLDGLEHAADQPHAAQIAEIIRQRFAGKLTKDQLSRLAVLEIRIQEQSPHESGRRTGRVGLPPPPR